MRSYSDIYKELDTLLHDFKKNFESFLSTENPYKSFYDAFLKLCYGENADSYGVMYLLAEVLSSELSARKATGIFEFWINYSPFNAAILKEHIGRIYNSREIAYRVTINKNCKTNSVDIKLDKISDDDVSDHILHYYKLFMSDDALKNEDIVSLHINLSQNSKIKVFEAKKEAEQIEIVTLSHDHILSVNQREKFDNAAQELFPNKKTFNNYIKYLKKIFYIDTSYPQYINDPKDFIDVPISIPNQFTTFSFYDGSFTFELGTIMIFVDSEAFILPCEIPEWLSTLRTWLSSLYQLEIDFNNKYATRKIQKESLKSAVSAIMTRNMSHNLGSHYLHYTKAQLEQLAKKGGEFGPDIRGAARVMGYMQGRMDYLATLVSGDRFPYGCVNFKSQIYDVLTIDDFSKRHFKNCKRVSNEQLSPIMEIVAEIQKNNNSKKNVREKIPDLYSKSRDALQNDGYSRTTNFLLSNLILSEGFTRSHILNDNENIENSINLHVLFDNQIFTGAPIVFDDTILNEIIKKEEKNGLSQEEAERKKELETQKSDKEKQRIAEEKAKQAISNINIAMPGGVMSCHAFFNIIENFIRNSAKYLQSDFSENKDLTITIKIAEKLVDHKQDKENSDDANGEKVDVYEFTIFDNKHNANKKQPDTNKSLLDDLVDKISNLCILDDNNVLDKKDKGFKEMLFSALWLRSYVYQNADGKNNPNSYEDVLVQIQSIKEPSVKLKQIKKYGFSFLAVDNDGQENDTEKANLALRFTLPKFNKTTKLELANDENIDLGNLLHIYADIASVDDGFTDFVKQLNKERADKEKDSYGEDMIIPRMLRKADSKITDVKALQTVLYTRFGEEFDNYKISSDDNNTSELEKQYNIYFKRHLSTQCKTMENYKNYAYADSVSGGNYTITLFDIYNRWVKNGRDTASEDYYEILKIKESALTRITLIDERLYKKMKVQKTETELACKNIRILNYNESNFSEDKIDNFIKLFTDDHKFNNGKDETHFLSIHLGIIEKIVKNADMFTLMKDEKGESISVDGRVKVFMRLLKEKFGPKVFISVHSGRGNFSAELEQSLDMYPFISMAALENVYENSKYLLSQLFYSTIYVGKGVANQHNQED